MGLVQKAHSTPPHRSSPLGPPHAPRTSRELAATATARPEARPDHSGAATPVCAPANPWSGGPARHTLAPAPPSPRPDVRRTDPRRAPLREVETLQSSRRRPLAWRRPPLVAAPHRRPCTLSSSWQLVPRSHSHDWRQRARCCQQRKRQLHNRIGVCRQNCDTRSSHIMSCAGTAERK